MTLENTTNDTFLCTSKKYISHSSIGVKFWCHSRDTNETFCSEKPSVAIILRYVDKMTGLWLNAVDRVLRLDCGFNLNMCKKVGASSQSALQYQLFVGYNGHGVHPFYDIHPALHVVARPRSGLPGCLCRNATFYSHKSPAWRAVSQQTRDVDPVLLQC